MSKSVYRRVLTPELEQRIICRLDTHWSHHNRRHFHQRLETPTIALHDERSAWVRTDRTIWIARSLILRESFALVEEVLLLQQLHQAVDELHGHTTEPAHTATWHSLCHQSAVREELVMTFGRSDLAGPRSSEEERVYTRIQRLLALANSPNQHEAEAAMAEAQRLLLKHNLGLTLEADPARQRYGVRHVGWPRERFSEAHLLLARILARHFFVKVLWNWVIDPFRSHPENRATAEAIGIRKMLGMVKVLELTGTPVNLDMAAYVHDYLWQVAERLWSEYRGSSEEAVGRERDSFMAGLMSGFLSKLDEQGHRNVEAGLIWLGDPALDRFFDQHNPSLRRGPITGGASHGESRDAGFSAGRLINLHRPVHDGGSGDTKGLLG